MAAYFMYARTEITDEAKSPEYAPLKQMRLDSKIGNIIAIEGA